ncbi:MAG: hypothetical protein R2864_09010 [Syntrophotaleaceae bacterium]
MIQSVDSGCSHGLSFLLILSKHYPGRVLAGTVVVQGRHRASHWRPPPAASGRQPQPCHRACPATLTAAKHLDQQKRAQGCPDQSVKWIHHRAALPTFGSPFLPVDDSQQGTIVWPSANDRFQRGPRLRGDRNPLPGAAPSAAVLAVRPSRLSTPSA